MTSKNIHIMGIPKLSIAKVFANINKCENLNKSTKRKVKKRKPTHLKLNK